MMKKQILAEIERLAATNGKPPGKLAFTRETGIKEAQWSGVYWARWSDALIEAGFEKNQMQGRFSTDGVLLHLIDACRAHNRVPSSADLRLYAKTTPLFPSHNTISNHFRTRAELVHALIEYVRGKAEFEDVASILPQQRSELTAFPSEISKEGFVYLLKSGSHYKIGKSDELERRVKEIRIALPETCSLAHSIRTDDPSGIEAYWHKRFAHLRANGEWFKLGTNELRAFRKRKYQ